MKVREPIGYVNPQPPNIPMNSVVRRIETHSRVLIVIDVPPDLRCTTESMEAQYTVILTSCLSAIR